MKLYEIKWEPTFDGIGGEVHFENGFGASVVCRGMSYGGKKGMWEIGLLKGDELATLNNEWNQSTCPEFKESEVDGWNNLESVENLLNRISELESEQSTNPKPRSCKLV